MMSIALVCENFPPDHGGISASASRIALALSTLARVHVVRFPRGTAEVAATERVAPTLYVHTVGPFVNGWPSPPSAEHRAALLACASTTVRTLLGGFDLDLVHGFGLQNSGLVAARLAYHRGVPLIQSVRGNDVGRNGFDASRRLGLRIALEQASYIVTVNVWLARLLTAHFPAFAPRVSVIPNGVYIEPLPTYEDLIGRRAEAGLPLGGPIVGTIGVVREKKGPHVLVDIADAFLRKNAGKLLVVGSIDLDHYRAIGWTAGEPGPAFTVRRAPTPNGVRALTSLCDMMVFPSLDDGMANGLLEAMERGKPLIASQVFGDVITHGEDGLIANPFVDGDFVHSCAALWADAGLRRRLGSAARRTICQRFTVDMECQRWYELYTSAIGNKQRASE